MRLRHLIFILVIVLILLILRPRQVWAEVKRIHRQWDLLLYLLVTVIIVYLAYGLFSIGGGETSGWPF